MFKSFIEKIIGTKSERDIKKIMPLVEEINSFEEAVAALSDDELRNKTAGFRAMLDGGQTIDDILPEAFACVREAAGRAIGLRHYDVQLIGGVVLHQGKIAEMKTGEGKTLVATLCAYINALSGEGVHIVTVNDYLAKRDRGWMGPVFEKLGLTVGYVQHDMDTESRRAGYASDITYVTNNEIGFDYLRDNMVVSRDERVLRPLNYAIVDEVDSILIDEARTPLIISGPAEESTQKYVVVEKIYPYLKGRKITGDEEDEAKRQGIDLGAGFDYISDEKHHNVTLTEEGNRKCENLLNIKSLYDDIEGEWVHHITQMLRAHEFFLRDVHYIVKDGEVVIVDEFTGRLMPGRRWSEGLHQAVEAKERLRVAEENQTLATITFQNYFRMYKKLSGMTGTAMTEATEFWEIYKLDVVEIPTHRPMIRQDMPDAVYRTEGEKINALVEEIEGLWKKGAPVLVGTRSIEKNEKLSAILRRRGVPCQVLNAKYHEQEASIIAQAGRRGTVTIATNMAGRGTDIVLGGNPPDEAAAAEIKELGGFHIIGTERHESRRIDNQLRGRCGRQGDPGVSKFFISLEDELMRLFGSDRISSLMGRLGMEEGEVIEHPWINRAIENAQRKVEMMNFDIRKQLLDFDNVMNKQREAVYSLRNEILDGEDVRTQISDMLSESVSEKISMWASAKYPESYDWQNLGPWFKKLSGREIPSDVAGKIAAAQLEAYFIEELEKVYASRESDLGAANLREMERLVLLQMMDHAWKEHLYDLDQIKKGIGLRAYGQKDPLIEYQKESLNLFEQMMRRIRETAVEYLFKIQFAAAPPRVGRSIGSEERDGFMPVGARSPAKDSPAVFAPSPRPASAGFSPAGPAAAVVPAAPAKLGRNDPCPCGSGKKYKKCCGR
ncbi:MAG: preprotein translocase subunit SecA [Elusimicrobia bacterium HGW-Elusimicrobia-1]|jgi:preprotein translocase subunit SecA|nr:MAG: preprotein translocase subunit SecA [Elusimicrobia bacterium HGW-Elusimicrobia-1]